MGHWSKSCGRPGLTDCIPLTASPSSPSSPSKSPTSHLDHSSAQLWIDHLSFPPVESNNSRPAAVCFCWNDFSYRFFNTCLQVFGLQTRHGKHGFHVRSKGEKKHKQLEKPLMFKNSMAKHFYQAWGKGPCCLFGNFHLPSIRTFKCFCRLLVSGRLSINWPKQNCS